jgi:hypothetical protein
MIISGDRAIEYVRNIAVRVFPAPDEAISALKNANRIEEEAGDNFVMGFYDFEIFMDLLRDLQQDNPLEIGISTNAADGRARLLRIRHREMTIYLAGMSGSHKEPEPAPDALDILQAENEALKNRIAELEMRSGL